MACVCVGIRTPNKDSNSSCQPHKLSILPFHVVVAAVVVFHFGRDLISSVTFPRRQRCAFSLYGQTVFSAKMSLFYCLFMSTACHSWPPSPLQGVVKRASLLSINENYFTTLVFHCVRVCASVCVCRDSQKKTLD